MPFDRMHRARPAALDSPRISIGNSWNFPCSGIARGQSIHYPGRSDLPQLLSTCPIRSRDRGIHHPGGPGFFCDSRRGFNFNAAVEDQRRGAR